jgi:hypothetical protein
MAIQTVLEKLQISKEKNILVQGLPSSIEKQFIKLSFAKSLTPLLKIKKIEFALIFAVSKKQLTDILNEVMPSLQPNAKLWISYPKATAKIASDLCREPHWQMLEDHCLEAVHQVELDNVWCATHFKLSGNINLENNSIPRYMLLEKESVEEAVL